MSSHETRPRQTLAEAAAAVKEPETVCAEADRLVSGDRRSTYGHPYDNFTDTAALWTVMLREKLQPGYSVDAVDVALCMTQVKMAREAHHAKRDNVVDACGYLKCLDLVRARMAELMPPAQFPVAAVMTIKGPTTTPAGAPGVDGVPVCACRSCQRYGA